MKTEITTTDALKATTVNIGNTVLSIDKNTVIKKVATQNIKVEKENILAYIQELLATPTEEIEKANPLFKGTNILYLFLQSQLAHLELQDKSTDKVVNLILWVVQKSGVNPFRFINSYKDLEVLKKYFSNFAIDENTDKKSLQLQLDEIIKFESFIVNYMDEKSQNPTPSYLRKADELKPLFTELRGNGKKLKEFLYPEIVHYNAIIKTVKVQNT